MAGILNTVVDPHIVEALMRGDRNAQEQVFRLLSAKVFTMAKRILNDQQCAEEVTQDTFLDVMTKVATLRKPDTFTSWVRTVAVNHCYMRLRSPWYQRREQLEVVVEPSAEASLDQAVGPVETQESGPNDCLALLRRRLYPRRNRDAV